jgi:hypothetical protein
LKKTSFFHPPNSRNPRANLLWERKHKETMTEKIKETTFLDQATLFFLFTKTKTDTHDTNPK